MQHDSFDKFSITRLWLLVRREVLMLTFWDYFIIFIMPFIFILFMLWLNLLLENNILETAVSGDIFSPWYTFYILPAILYVTNLGYFYSGFRQTDGLKISPNPFPRGMLPVKIMEKFIAEFICFAVLFPLAIQILLFLPFLIFRVDLFIWLSAAVAFFAICSPLTAFRFLRIAVVEDTSLHRYHDVIPPLVEITELLIFMGAVFGFMFYSNVLPLHYLAITAVAITVILWWTAYRIRLKNAKR